MKNVFRGQVVDWPSESRTGRVVWQDPVSGNVGLRNYFNGRVISTHRSELQVSSDGPAHQGLFQFYREQPEWFVMLQDVVFELRRWLPPVFGRHYCQLLSDGSWITGIYRPPEPYVESAWEEGQCPLPGLVDFLLPDWGILARCGLAYTLTSHYVCGGGVTFDLRLAPQNLRPANMNLIYDDEHPLCACLRALLDWKADRLSLSEREQT